MQVHNFTLLTYMYCNYYCPIVADARVLSDAEHYLTQLGAMGSSGELTPKGLQMAKLPVEPSHALMLLGASQRGCSAEVSHLFPFRFRQILNDNYFC